MDDLILTNAQLVLPDRVTPGSLVIRNGVIDQIDAGSSNAPGAIDCAGDFLAPGLVELHTDNIERHVLPRPGAQWPLDAAILAHDREIAAAGITTCFDAVCVGEVHPKSLRVEIVDEVCDTLQALAGADALKADHRLHLRCEISYGGLLALLAPHIDRAILGLVSVMDHTPGARQYVKLEHYAEYYQGKFALSDAELESFIAERRADGARYSASNRRAVVELAHARSLPLASHDDATAEHVDEAKRDGAVVAEFPTTHEAARRAHESGLAVLMGGPNVVRGRSHTGNVSASDLCEQGLLDIVSSDYVPSSALHAALILAADPLAGDETTALARAIAMVSATPAKAIGLDDRGAIAEGLRADLVRFSARGSTPVIGGVWRQGIRIA